MLKIHYLYTFLVFQKIYPKNDAKDAAYSVCEGKKVLRQVGKRDSLGSGQILDLYSPKFEAINVNLKLTCTSKKVQEFGIKTQRRYKNVVFHDIRDSKQ